MEVTHVSKNTWSKNEAAYKIGLRYALSPNPPSYLIKEILKITLELGIW